jgi:hypothetical protein
MEITGSSKTVVYYHITTLYHTPEDHDLNCYSCLLMCVDVHLVCNDHIQKCPLLLCDFSASEIGLGTVTFPYRDGHRAVLHLAVILVHILDGLDYRYWNLTPHTSQMIMNSISSVVTSYVNTT